MQKLRYIGNKTALLNEIEQALVGSGVEEGATFIDAFGGTGSVGEFFKTRFQIVSNDLLYFAAVLQKSRIELKSVPDFATLKAADIADPIKFLETAPVTPDQTYFILRNYSPFDGCDRMYLTPEIAMRVDFIRQRLNLWKRHELVNDSEFNYLLACLIETVPLFSNTSGTYGAYLKTWDKRALKPFKLVRVGVVPTTRENKVFNIHAEELVRTVKGAVLYLDPPYNSRQYLSNYHLLETVARYDSPEISGITGTRVSKHGVSDFCKKSNVYVAMEEMIRDASVDVILLSYSSDAILSADEITEILQKHCIAESVALRRIPYKKYRSKIENIDASLDEFIFSARKTPLVSKSFLPVMERAKALEFPADMLVKGPLNYIGGKHKLLPQLIPLFPKDVETFYDVFAGGLNVGVNAPAKKVVASDINKYVIELLQTLISRPYEETLSHIEGRVREFNLTVENEGGFRRFRDVYNGDQQPLDLYVLLCYSFNYQIRFNSNHQFNVPFGKGKSNFSEKLRAKLERFIGVAQNRNMELLVQDFTQYDLDTFGRLDLVYCDPPYLITTGSYNDGNRGFKDWSVNQETRLLEFLDELDRRGVRFALSNVLRHKGRVNDLLCAWCTRYNVHHLSKTYSNASYNTARGESDEVLICNY
jgi:adenine-specific DNA-methyltransferase